MVAFEKNHWLNLYDSLNSLKIDTISKTDKHPGLKSQIEFFNYLHPVFLDKLISNK